MKASSVIGLLFVAAIFATVPISPQVTPRGVELSVDQAQAITYGRHRRVSRRAGYAAVGYRRVAVGPRRSCTIYPSGFLWCWTQF
jgi:hypothetical protein